MATEIWGLRVACTLSLRLVSGSRFQCQGKRSCRPSTRWLYTCFSAPSRSKARGLCSRMICAASTMSALCTCSSSLTRRDLADNTGYLVAFNHLVREFEGRAVGVPSAEPSTSQARRASCARGFVSCSWRLPTVAGLSIGSVTSLVCSPK